MSSEVQGSAPPLAAGAASFIQKRDFRLRSLIRGLGKFNKKKVIVHRKDAKYAERKVFSIAFDPVIIHGTGIQAMENRSLLSIRGLRL